MYEKLKEEANKKVNNKNSWFNTYKLQEYNDEDFQYTIKIQQGMIIFYYISNISIIIGIYIMKCLQKESN